MDMMSYLLGKNSGGTSGGGSYDWAAIGYSAEPDFIKEGYDYAKDIYDNWDASITTMFRKYKDDMDLIFFPLVDTSNVTAFDNAFESCYALKTVPALNTSKSTGFSSMFYECYSLEKVDLFDTSKGILFRSMFNRCACLKTIPAYDTSNGTNFTQMFQYCESIENIPLLDFGNATDVSGMFYMDNTISHTITLGGFKDLGKAYLTTRNANYSNYRLDLHFLSGLTHDSLMNVINNLYDIASAGVQTQQLILGATNLAKLTEEEIAIATNKGWAVS